MNRQAIIFWVTILFAVFAILDGLFGRRDIHYSSILVPFIVFCTVFLLYKFPPKKYRRSTPKIKSSARTADKVAKARQTSKLTPDRTTNGSNGKRKSYPFQVIQGQKGKNEDDYPRYH